MMFNTILVALDGSDHANKALDTACSIAASNSSDLHLVHAAEIRPISMGSASVVSVLPSNTLRKIGENLLSEAASRAKQSYGGEVTLHNIFDDSAPGNSILARAEEIGADLIVVGSLGHSDLAGLLLGSVSHRICNHAKCSCLVVR
ncbi:MAG: universal stress protein [Halioglobus sp.]